MLIWRRSWRRSEVVDSLRDRLAATLAAHRVFDEVRPGRLVDGRDGPLVRWTCPCGGGGEWQPWRWTAEVTSTALADMRAHQAGKLAETVTEWLDGRAEGLRRLRAAGPSVEACEPRDDLVADRKRLQHSLLTMAVALESARDDIRAEVTE